MSESISQGIPFLNLSDIGLRLLKCNDISFTNLRREGFNCLSSAKKPDQLVCLGKRVIIGIEDKNDARDLETAITQIKDNYLDALPETNYFMVRAGDIVNVFFRNSSTQILEIGTTLKGKEVVCFGARVISGENIEAQKTLTLLAEQIVNGKTPINSAIEIQPPKEYYNPLVVKQQTIRTLWQKIFVSTGENAHNCLSTFVELLLYKGISDAGLLPRDYSIDTLANPNTTNSLRTYKTSVRNYIKTELFPTIANQPGVINGFAFEEQETVFKTVLHDLCELGNLSQRQIDPDFKRRIIEAFLGSAHKEGAIKNGKHLTPRIIIQAIWEMANPVEEKRIVDPACGVGGFVLEGLNYPYEFNPLHFNCIGIDRDEQMIITAKANMILHVLDKFSDPSLNKHKLIEIINKSFYQAKNNGTGTLGELTLSPTTAEQYKVNHPADYVFANVPFYVNGVTQIDESLRELGFSNFYNACGIGVESRFIKYILGQIKTGNPGVAFVIVTDGILYRQKDNIRNVIKQNADVMGIVSLPVGVFQNNNWKTSILIFKRKEAVSDYTPVFLYNVENIGVSLDAFRTPIEKNDIPDLKKAWGKRLSGFVSDTNCRIISRDEFLRSEKWSDLFSWCRDTTNDDVISFGDFVSSAIDVNKNIAEYLHETDNKLGGVFQLDNYIEVELGDSEYFETFTADFKTTIRHARLHPGQYPLYSSQIDGEVAKMFDENNPPILSEHGDNEKLISWNIKGDPCKDIRVHTEPFYVTENRGLIKINNDNIIFDYLLFYLREHLIKLGRFNRANEAHAGKVKRIKIRIPIKDDGSIDVDKQLSIAANYQSILELKSNLLKQLSALNNLIQNIDIFK